MRARMKKLDVNMYQMDDGVIISARERDFMTYNEGVRFVRIPLETIKTGNDKYGAAVIFGRYLKWSTNEPLTEQDIEKIKLNITEICNNTGYQYQFEP
jgi:hypothetical protein